VYELFREQGEPEAVGKEEEEEEFNSDCATQS
jgi:hypothetical protein